jgi:hypothetical protein
MRSWVICDASSVPRLMQFTPAAARPSVEMSWISCDLRLVVSLSEALPALLSVHLATAMRLTPASRELGVDVLATKFFGRRESHLRCGG